MHISYTLNPLAPFMAPTMDLRATYAARAHRLIYYDMIRINRERMRDFAEMQKIDLIGIKRALQCYAWPETVFP